MDYHHDSERCGFKRQAVIASDRVEYNNPTKSTYRDSPTVTKFCPGDIRNLYGIAK